MAEEEKKQEWSKRTTQLVSLMALFLAVCATFASLKSGGANNTAILSQSQASDMWAYYQAKSLKENTYRIQVDSIKLTNPAPDSENAKLMEKYKQKADRYEKEQKEIMQQARDLESTRDAAIIKRTGFANSVTYLQIGIVLTSLGVLVKQLHFCYISAVIGGYGAIQFFMTLLG